MVEQGRAGFLARIVLCGGELGAEFAAAGAQFGASLVDVADEVLVDGVGELKVADQALALGLGLGDGAAQGGDPAGPLLLGLLAVYCQADREQLMAIEAEDPLGQERGQPVEEIVFADAEDDRMPVRPVGVLRRAGIPGDMALGVAEHPPPAEVIHHDLNPRDHNHDSDDQFIPASTPSPSWGIPDEPIPVSP